MARRRIDPDEELDPDELEELEEEGAFDSRGLLKDGHSTTVKLYMRDGAINPNLTPTQRGKAAQQTEDAVARRFGLTDGLQLHRPGFRRVTDTTALERVQRAYNDVDSQAANAWRGNVTTDQRAGDPCTVRAPEYPLDFGSAGTMQKRNGDLVCVPTKQRQDAAAFDAKAQAYADYDREMANAWRNPR